jgi:hypothetical protein
MRRSSSTSFLALSSVEQSVDGAARFLIIHSRRLARRTHDRLGFLGSQLATYGDSAAIEFRP